MMAHTDRANDPLTKISRVNALLRCAICADDTSFDPETLFGDNDKGIWQVLEIAERLSDELQEDIEMMQRKLGEGIWRESK